MTIVLPSEAMSTPPFFFSMMEEPHFCTNRNPTKNFMVNSSRGMPSRGIEE
jgi:hypothetical protein